MSSRPKEFIHHDLWFKIFPHKLTESWVGGGYVLLCDECRFTNDKLYYPTFYHYVKEDDTLWSISREESVAKRQLYNGRYHIDRVFLTPVVITDAWRYKIDGYERNRDGKVQPHREVPA